MHPAILFYLEMPKLTRKVVEGTRGPFYTIGRSSLPAADTLRRRRRRINIMMIKALNIYGILNYGKALFGLRDIKPRVQTQEHNKSSQVNLET